MPSNTTLNKKGVKLNLVHISGNEKLRYIIGPMLKLRMNLMITFQSDEMPSQLHSLSHSKTIYTNNNVTVSYTHLDVYKRQGYCTVKTCGVYFLQNISFIWNNYYLWRIPVAFLL